MAFEGTLVRWERTAEVRCDQHGPMQHREDTHWWECHGFDGEGCAVQVVYVEDAYRGGIPGVTIMTTAL
jgi:hypothetical protein